MIGSLRAIICPNCDKLLQAHANSYNTMALIPVHKATLWSKTGRFMGRYPCKQSGKWVSL